MPLPWCTSQSRIITRSAPSRRAASAATATLLNRQKPIAWACSAWCPGGRAQTKALAASLAQTASTAATAAPAPRRGRLPAAARDARCRGRAGRACRPGPPGWPRRPGRAPPPARRGWPAAGCRRTTPGTGLRAKSASSASRRAGRLRDGRAPDRAPASVRRRTAGSGWLMCHLRPAPARRPASPVSPSPLRRLGGRAAAGPPGDDPDAVFLELVVERAGLDPQQASGLGLHPRGLVVGPLDELPLEVLEDLRQRLVPGGHRQRVAGQPLAQEGRQRAHVEAARRWRTPAPARPRSPARARCPASGGSAAGPGPPRRCPPPRG